MRLPPCCCKFSVERLFDQPPELTGFRLLSLLIFQQVMAATRIAIAATPPTTASAITIVLFVEVEDRGVVLDEIVEEVGVAPNPVLAVLGTRMLPGEVASAVFCAGSAMNPLAVQ